MVGINPIRGDVVVVISVLALLASCDPRACNHNGLLAPSGKCVCDAGWFGDQCSELALLPANGTNLGTIYPADNKTSSWGGTVGALFLLCLPASVSAALSVCPSLCLPLYAKQVSGMPVIRNGDSCKKLCIVQHHSTLGPMLHTRQGWSQKRMALSCVCVCLSLCVCTHVCRTTHSNSSLLSLCVR